MRADGVAQPDVDELVRKAQEGDAASLGALYERFFDQIFRYVSFKTSNLSVAEDITGDVFLKMLESIHTFRWQGHPFSSWLFRIAHNLVVDHYRKSGKRKTVPLENAASRVGATSSDLDRQVEIDLMMDEVRGAIGGLTGLQREVISLRFAAGLSVAETARAVRKKENAVKALQHAGLKKLRALMGAQPDVTVAVQQR